MGYICERLFYEHLFLLSSATLLPLVLLLELLPCCELYLLCGHGNSKSQKKKGGKEKLSLAHNGD